MKRRDLIRHLETTAVNSCAKAVITPFTSIDVRRNLLRFRGIAKSSISSRGRSAKTWTFPSHETRDAPQTRAAAIRQKIRKVGELIRLSRKIKAQHVREDGSNYPQSGLPAVAGNPKSS
jgi:hypothetical protein